MKNPNIYDGDKNKYVEVTFELLIPEGLNEDETEQYIKNTMGLIEKNFISYKIGNKFKGIQGKDVLKRGWRTNEIHSQKRNT